MYRSNVGEVVSLAPRVPLSGGVLRADSHRMKYDVGIIGAGVAGLAAAGELRRAGLKVQCLEASNRVGGRVLTLRDPQAPVPIELGAEFVHGRPKELWDLIKARNLTVFEHTPRALRIRNGREVKDDDTPAGVADGVMERMSKKERGQDHTFDEFLRRSRYSVDAKNWARIYVEGFNAARSDSISTGSLVAEADAAEEIDGDRTFRILNGYDSIPMALLVAIPDHASVVRLNSVVEKVQWSRGKVEVTYRSALTQEKVTLQCRRLVITVGLGILQALPGSDGTIRFDPEPPALKAAGSLKFGQVYRVTLRFSESFWEAHEQFASAGFLVSQDKRFFTWWTTHPVLAPILTGWMAGSAADEFGKPKDSVVAAEAIASLSRILNRKIPQPQASYFHNWKTDPYFRGAYSYVPVSARGAREALAKPQSGTLFFAGEAADIQGRGSTVHGAIASGRKAAALIIGR